MTTIAYRDGVLAADTQSTTGGNRDGSVVKVAKRGPYLAAASGCGVLSKKFLDWFRAGMNGDAPCMKVGDDSATGHIFTPDGKRLSLFGQGWYLAGGAFFAEGSGWEFAKGAMSMGASAEQAVRVAMEHDTRTGGAIVVLTH